ncbi:MAG: hypothetical protein JW849_01560 [Phycisphaerae bacterium]|nr:hypothetical protein [Phycisphaerae bacterium]
MEHKKRTQSKAPATGDEFVKRFDAGEDMGGFVKPDSVVKREPNRRVNVDFPAWMVDELDSEARRLGISRQAVIKVCVAEKLETQRTR